MNVLGLITSYTFEFALIAMIAATIYFVLERYRLSDEYKPVSTFAILTTALAVIEYFNMREFFTIENLSKADLNFPTEFRYITWLIATPLMLYTYFVLTKLSRYAKPIVILTISLNFLMITSGYFSESAYSNGWMPMVSGTYVFSYFLFGVGTACWAGIIYIFIKVLPGQVVKVNDQRNAEYCLKCLSFVQKLIIYGWAIYPLGLFVSFWDGTSETALMREMIYNFGDLFNKVGFALICFSCAKKLSKKS